MKPKHTHEFRVTVESDSNRRIAELAILSAFAKRDPDGCKFLLRKKPPVAKPKQPRDEPFEFDWTGIDPKYKWAAMDADGWWAYTYMPRAPKHLTYFVTQNGSETKVFHKPYPGDWRDSLQQRP